MSSQHQSPVPDTSRAVASQDSTKAEEQYDGAGKPTIERDSVVKAATADGHQEMDHDDGARHGTRQSEEEHHLGAGTSKARAMITSTVRAATRHASPGPAALISHEELTDLRALQRTFDGAYTRTALAQLSYAILILRLFERDFYWCGLVYTVLAVQLIGIATYRYNLAMQNQDRWNKVNIDLSDHRDDAGGDARPEAAAAAPDANAHAIGDTHQDSSSITLGPEAIHVPLFRPTFRTAGTVVAVATSFTLIIEIVLAILVIRL